MIPEECGSKKMKNEKGGKQGLLNKLLAIVKEIDSYDEKKTNRKKYSGTVRNKPDKHCHCGSEQPKMDEYYQPVTLDGKLGRPVLTRSASETNPRWTPPCSRMFPALDPIHSCYKPYKKPREHQHWSDGHLVEDTPRSMSSHEESRKYSGASKGFLPHPEGHRGSQDEGRRVSGHGDRSAEWGKFVDYQGNYNCRKRTDSGQSDMKKRGGGESMGNHKKQQETKHELNHVTSKRIDGPEWWECTKRTRYGVPSDIRRNSQDSRGSGDMHRGRNDHDIMGERQNSRCGSQSEEHREHVKTRGSQYSTEGFGMHMQKPKESCGNEHGRQSDFGHHMNKERHNSRELFECESRQQSGDQTRLREENQRRRYQGAKVVNYLDRRKREKVEVRDWDIYGGQRCSHEHPPLVYYCYSCPEDPRHDHWSAPRTTECRYPNTCVASCFDHPVFNDWVYQQPSYRFYLQRKNDKPFMPGF